MTFPKPVFLWFFFSFCFGFCFPFPFFLPPVVMAGAQCWHYRPLFPVVNFFSLPSTRITGRALCQHYESKALTVIFLLFSPFFFLFLLAEWAGEREVLAVLLRYLWSYPCSWGAEGSNLGPCKVLAHDNVCLSRHTTSCPPSPLPRFK